MSTSTHRRGDFALDARLLRIATLAAVIGAASTGAARVLLDLIRFFTNLFFFQDFSLADRSPAGHTMGAWVIAVPVLGGLVIGLIARYGSEKIRGHGIPEAIEAILFGRSKMSPKVAVLKPLSSGIAIGSGGPFGAEGPIIMTGGAIGSLIAQHFHLSAAERKALLVAGATAGMTAVFGTPVAAVLLAVELLLFELRPRSLLPVAIACAVAGFTRPLLMEAGPLFPLQTAAPGPLALLSCVVAGLLCGALSASLSLSLYKVEDLFGKLPLHWMWWPALGGLAVGIGGYFEPRALGVGYDVIGDLLHNQLAWQAVLALIAVKAIIWVIALGSGTSGGVLAPLLMMGAALGAVLSHLLPGGDPMLWPLVCMAATLGGTMRAPLMATVFAFGLTHDSNALLPLLATSATAYGFTVLTMRRSILTEKIARRGHHIYREYGIDPLERQFVEEVMTREVHTIDAALPVAEALAMYFGEGQAHRAFPVLRGRELIGVADRAVLSAWSNGTVGDAVAGTPPVVALPGENCRAVATRLARHGLERLPVVRDADSRLLVGIVARSDLIKPSLAHFHEEEQRERVRSLRWRR
ncbi:chloride channel protein [Variovorax paradoxus]|jgi:H+/Cl- antiporter ClcA|uniref:chloride channel protein n=1 Tax=Variovorax paradoxus TaxID=34073 RepID=UPI0006E584E0|nr:chloride channel protein [Variovorax paradoxus]KPU88418.1 chloride channel protein [Variovorax paradoxus]KPU88628.1 chloride channel protein [Variovorax paradoxus]KPV05380.1 chloride channel protein [Variovorax paradoxus]KPV15940.1 chloride channel protein [Variovorax paradoxus]